MTRRMLCLIGVGLLAACGARVSQGADDDSDGGSSSGSASSGSSSSGAASTSSGGIGSSSGGSSSGIIVTSSGSGSGGTSGSGGSSGVAPSEDGGELPPPANLMIVHAAAGLGPFRLCIGVSSAGQASSVAAFQAIPDGPGWSGGSAIPPSPNGVTAAAGTPGIYPGTVQALAAFGTSLEALVITPYIIDATSIAADINYDGGNGTGPDGGAEETCVALIGSHGSGMADSPVAGRLVLGVNYWSLPAIPAGTLRDGSSYLFGVTGCVPGYEVGDASVHDGITPVGTCGPDFSATKGNLALDIEQLDTTTVVNGLGLQFVNLSSALRGNSVDYGGSLTHGPASDGVIPGYMTGDGTFTPIASDTLLDGYGGEPTLAVSVPPATDGGVGAVALAALTEPGSDDGGATSMLPYPGGHPTPGSGTFASGDLIALSLSPIVTMSNWQASMSGAPSSFVNGQTFTLVLVGNNDPYITQIVDPDLDLNPTLYDGRGLHLVAFPNRFTPLPLP